MGELHYGLTPYNYVLNNPLKFIDPLGLDTIGVNNMSQKVWENFNTQSDVIGLNEVRITSDNEGGSQEVSGVGQQQRSSNVLSHIGMGLNALSVASNGIDVAHNGRIANDLNRVKKYMQQVNKDFDAAKLYARTAEYKNTDKVRRLTGAGKLAKFSKVADPAGSIVGIGLSINKLATGNGNALDLADVGVSGLGLAAPFLITNPKGLTRIGVGSASYFGYRLYQDFTDE